MSGNDTFTKVLLHLDGTNGSTTITDSNAGGSAKTWTNHTGSISTSTSQFGGASYNCSTTGWVTTPDATDFTLGTGDFTIDFWFNINATLAGRIFGQDSAAGTDRSFSGTITALNNIAAQWTLDGTTAPTLSGVTSVTTGVWHHYAFVRSGTTAYLFLDGVLESSTALTGTIWDSASVVSVGQIGARTGSIFNGFVDEFRFSKGIARWTSNFTPPNAAYDRINPQAVAATCTSTVTPFKRAGKIVALTCTSAVNLIKRIGKIVSAACTSTTTFKKAVTRTIAVTCTSTTAVIKRAAHTITSITVTTATALFKSPGKIISAAVSTSVSLIKLVGKIVEVLCTSFVNVFKRGPEYRTFIKNRNVRSSRLPIFKTFRRK